MPNKLKGEQKGDEGPIGVNNKKNMRGGDCCAWGG